MVSVVALPVEGDTSITAGLSGEDAAKLRAVAEFVVPYYEGKKTIFGEEVSFFSLRTVDILASMNSDVETRMAGLLFEWFHEDAKALKTIEEKFGKDVSELVQGVVQLMRFHEHSALQQEVMRGKNAAQKAADQVETLRKMLLAMASDIRVVLIRLASRLAMLRYFSEAKLVSEEVESYAHQTMDLYAPLANRLGIWQVKWELEDLSFRFMQPDTYKRVAKMLEEKRVEREEFVASAITRLEHELSQAGVKAEVTGRPKHIYSIWNKMQHKHLDFSELYDVRAFRVIVDDIKTCYTVLGIVHNIWTPIPREFDDYISRPKPNGYQSLHTVVIAEDGRPLEVQIRTWEMQRFAEYGVAAHWRYKESGNSSFSAEKYDEKIAWLRQLLAWKSEVADAVVEREEVRRDWVQKLKSTTLDDRIYVLTPQARVIELPHGATAIDFAYHLHSNIGHRCRGAKVDGVMVPLNTPLKSGQTVEIITVKGVQGSAQASVGPSRDWLSPGYTASNRTRAKIRAWFNAIEQQETLSNGRAILDKILQREGKTVIKHEELAQKLGFAKTDDLLLALGKDTLSPRQVEQVLSGDEPVRQELSEEDITRKSRASSTAQGAKSGVLIVGTDGLMTQLARCCKPAPPDPIIGFVTRGKGVSIHRTECKNFAQMCLQAPERVIEADWGSSAVGTVYPVDLYVLAVDRQGLLRDISDVFLREKINVVGVSTQSMKGQARMTFVVEIASTEQLGKAITVISEVKGVIRATRI